MLNDLVECITTLQNRIRTKRTSLEGNEWRTRPQLIEPLLRALGWDVSDPDRVTPEWKVSGKRADYALLQTDGNPVALLEAKGLGTALDDKERTQVLTYALLGGIDYAGLTDGDRWEMYRVSEKGDLDEKRVLAMSIIETPVHVATMRLLLLWHSNLETGDPEQAVTHIIQPKPTVVPPHVIVKPPIGDQWVPLSKYDPPPKTKPPSSVWFWDGENKRINYWKEVLIETAEKLYRDSLLSVGDAPIRWSNKTAYRINTKPLDHDGKKFRSFTEIAGGRLFVNTWLNASQHRYNTVRLLEKYRKDPETVWLDVGL